MSTAENNHPREASQTDLKEKDVVQEFCPSNLPIWHIVKRECSVLDCNSNSSNSTMFAFPQPAFNNKNDFGKCKVWLQACGNESLLQLNLFDIHQHAFVCSSHFETSHFQDDSRNDLVSTAVPILHLPLPLAAEKLDEYFVNYCKEDTMENQNANQHPASTTNGDTEDPETKQEVIYRCSSCTKRFYDQDSLETHHKLTHSEDGPFECHLCNRTFIRGCDYKRHIRVHTTKMRHVCMECERCFTNKAAFLRHARGSHSEGTPFYCSPCNRRFSSSGALKSHLRTHSGEKPFACTMCDQRFFTNSSLKLHRVTHASKDCKCTVCGEMYPDKETLTNHFKIHEREKPFACNRCHRRFSQQKHLIIHLRTHNGFACFRCKFCNRRCVSEESLKLHTKAHLDNEPAICPHCNAKFSTYNRLIQHYCKSIRGKRNVCPVCLKQFPTKSVLDIHLPVHDVREEPDKPYACSVCYKRFMTKTRLDSHIFTQHDSEYGGASCNVVPPEEEEVSKTELSINERNEENGPDPLADPIADPLAENAQFDEESEMSPDGNSSISVEEDTKLIMKQEREIEQELAMDSFGKSAGTFVLGME